MTRGIGWPDPVRMRTRNAEMAYSFILETYIAPLQETTTLTPSQPRHGQRRASDCMRKMHGRRS